VRAVPSSERGQVLPLLLVLLVLAAASAVVVARVAQAAGERSRAQVAADAAALAGAAAGRGAATATATANGAVLVRYEAAGGHVRVTVAHGRARASAEAVGTPAPPAGDRRGLAPAMLAALARADALLGWSVTVTSGYRSRAEQEALWERRHQNQYPVAPPGTSLHEVGLAIDVPKEEVPALVAVASEAGLCQPLPQTDPVHFEPCLPSLP
jgi:hypothetical protein